MRYRVTTTLFLCIVSVLLVHSTYAQERRNQLLNEPPQQDTLRQDTLRPVTSGGQSGGVSSLPQNRTAVIVDYNQNFLGSAVSDEALGWTGSLAGCVPGTNSELAQNRTIQRINYYRRLVGLPDNMTFDASRNGATQAAALIMGANNSLSHNPPTTWLCYTPQGATGAANSNLGLGSHSSQAVEQYMNDGGSNNTDVGHRRWLLYSRAASFGSGNTRAANAGFGFANALWVFNPFVTSAFLPSFIAFPPAGFVPRRLIPPRWSFSLPGASFSAAAITVKDENGTNLSITKHPVTNGYGDNTVAWELNNPDTDLAWTGSNDKSFAVTVSGVVLNGVTQAPYAYTVVAIDPAAICPTPSPVAACSITAGGGLSPFYGVETFRFGTISTLSSSAANDGANYQNLSCATQTTVTAGSSYSLAVKGYYTNTHALKVWIDFNGNGLLNDPGELVLSTTANSASVAVGIPVTASTANPLRIRVMADSPGGASNSPCTLTGGGQVDDYAVWVQSGCTTPESVQNGSWSNPATWSCGRVPTVADPVVIRHAVTIAGGNTIQARSLTYAPTGRLTFGTNSRLVLTP